MDDLKIGSIISFGSYKWRVLDIQNAAALIITEEIIEKRSYHDVYKDITWADCSLRNYLNGQFYDKFSEVDKSRIIPVLNNNPDNQWYGTKGGENTRDSIFLLSIEETACKYFGDSSSKLYNPGKNQRYWFERKDENNSKRIARLAVNKWASWWWQRSPGRVSVKAVYIHGDGNIGIQGNNILKGNIGDGKCIGGGCKHLSTDDIKIYFVTIPEHKFLHIKNYESNGYWDFWQKQKDIPGQDCDTICGLLESIKGKLDDKGGSESNSGSGQLMAYINDPNGKPFCYGIPRTECYGIRLAPDYEGEVPPQMLLIDVPEGEYIVYEHGPFSYEQENYSVEEKVETAIENFDFSNTDYCSDTSPGRIAYFFHDPEQFWKCVRPVRKK